IVGARSIAEIRPRWLVVLLLSSRPAPPARPAAPAHSNAPAGPSGVRCTVINSSPATRSLLSALRSAAPSGPPGTSHTTKRLRPGHDRQRQAAGPRELRLERAPGGRGRERDQNGACAPGDRVRARRASGRGARGRKRERTHSERTHGKGQPPLPPRRAQVLSP